MAPSRKRATAPPRQREFKLRLPADLSERIAAKALKLGQPQTRVVINELSEFPALEKFRDVAALIEGAKIDFARYSARIIMADLTDEMLQAVDAALAAEGTAQQAAAFDRVRALRGLMRKHKAVAE